MKIEVTVERLRHGKWARHATGKFTGDDAGGSKLYAWLKEKGVPDDPSKAPGWAVRIACTA